MEVTEIKIRLSNREKFKGSASVIMDNCLAIHGIAIIDGVDGFFIAMPSKKDRYGQYRDIVHPINNDLRVEIETAILDEYERILNDGGQSEY